MSEQIAVTLPDGSRRELPEGATGADLAASIGTGLARDALAVKVDGAVTDLDRPLPDGADVAVVTPASDDGRYVLRHSTAHVLAQAVTDLFPGAKFAIGPPIEHGFYYDFELPGGGTFSDDDLARITDRMREIIAADQPFVRDEHDPAAGLELFADQPFKQEIITNVDSSEVGDGSVVSTYSNPRGDGTEFVDLCRGPHVPGTGRLGHFQLQKVAGAYWRGDERNEMLQRIYGTAWESKKALQAHLTMLEEAEARDHRRLGVELDLFHFPPEIGGGLPVFHPKGGLIRKLMEDYSREEHEAAGYQFVSTPHLAKSTLFETSGHLQWYAEGMYPPMEMEGSTYYPKPMNCPMHMLIYKAQQRSYRELPMRLFELGTVYRFERSGVLHGLMRARGFTQDDSHIFCAPEQLADELTSLLEFVIRLLRTFGFSEFSAELSTRPDKFVGEPEDWDAAEAALEHALKVADVDYEVAEGEGAFYAPKIDVHIRDAIGRAWQMSTLQVDFQLPQRFDLEYVGADNTRHRPRVIHRALFGSIERFFGVLVEHYAGALPTWLSPVQATIVPVRDDHEPHAAAVETALGDAGIRTATLVADEPLGARIRRAKLDKVPYVLVVGDDDVAHDTLGVNPRGGDVQRDVPLADFVERIRSEVDQRA